MPPPTEVLWWLCHSRPHYRWGWLRVQTVDSGLCGLVPAEPFPDQCRENQGAGNGFTQVQSHHTNTSEQCPFVLYSLLFLLYESVTLLLQHLNLPKWGMIRDISIKFSILFFLLAQSMWFNQYVGYLCLCCCWFFSLAGEKSKGITYKELKWNKVVKNNEKCSLQLLAVCFMLCFWSFSPVLCELCCSPGAGYLPSQFDRHIGPLLLMCMQTDTFAEP